MDAITQATIVRGLSCTDKYVFGRRPVHY